MSRRKILTGFIFVIAGAIVGATFVTATSYSQLIVAIFLYSLFVLFFFAAFPRSAPMMHYRGSVTAIQSPIVSTGEIEATKGENADMDLDKRMFLKVIGGAGLAFFLFSVFRNKLDGLFFKGLPAPMASPPNNINGADLAQNQPMDGYNISEIDDSVIAFYGFTNNDGEWFIMKEDTDAGSFRYTKGSSNFPGSWSNRTHLKYDYYSNVFKL